MLFRGINFVIKNILRKENIAFGGLQWFFWSGVCTIIAFMVVFLKSSGYSESQIGIIMSAISIGSVLGQPFWGNVSDRKNAIRNVLVFSLVFSAFITLLIPLSAKYFTPVIIFCFLMSFTENSMPAIIDSWTLSHSTSKPWIDYGLTRGMGSLGFALTAIVFGFFIDKYGYNIMFYSHFIFVIIAVVFCFIIEPKNSGIVSQSADNRSRMSFAKIKFKDSKKFIWFLIAATLVFTGFRANATFFPILLTERGGNNSMLGIAFFIMAGSEFPVLFASKKLLRKFKDTTLITISMVFFCIRILLHIIIVPVPLLILSQATQGLSFAIFLPACVYYIRRISPAGLTSTYLTIATSCYFGMGGILGSYFGGIITENSGIFTMLKASLIVTFLGLVVFIFAGRKKTTPVSGVKNPGLNLISKVIFK